VAVAESVMLARDLFALFVQR